MANYFINALSITSPIKSSKSLTKCLMLSAFLLLLGNTSQVFASDALLCGKTTPPKLAQSLEASQKDKEETEEDKASYQSCFYGIYGLGVSLLDPEGTSNGWSSDDKPSFGGSIGIGWDMSNHWFGEFRYTFIGNAGLENSNPAVDSSIDAEVRYHAPSLMLGRKFFSNATDHNAFVKVGATWIKNQESDDSIALEDDSDIQASIGAGFRFNIQDSPWFIDLVYDGFSKDANMVSIQFNRFFSPRKSKMASTTETKSITQPAIEQPLPDDDHDGIENKLDRCPFSKSGEKVDKHGCCLAENGCNVSFPEH